MLDAAPEPRRDPRGVAHDTPLWDLGSPPWPEPAAAPLARAQSVTGWELGAVLDVAGDGWPDAPEPPPATGPSSPGLLDTPAAPPAAAGPVASSGAVVEATPGAGSALAPAGGAGPSPARAWARALAAASDLALLAAAGLPPIGLAVRRPLASGLPATTALACGAFLALLGFTYGTLAHALMGATLGERMFGLRLRQRDGACVGPGRCAARAALTVTGIAAGGLGLLVGLFTPSRRCLPDLVLGTVVVRAP